MSAPSELWTATPGKRPWQTAYQRFRELERWLTDEHPSGRAFLVLLRGAVQGRHVFDRKLREYRAVRGGPTPGRLPEPPAELVSELRAIAGLRSCYDREACGFVFEDVGKEYTRHGAGEGNPIGSLQLVVPYGVPRIDNRAGVFVVAGLSQIFDQYVAF